MQLPKTATLTAHDVNGVVYYSFPQMDAHPFLKSGISTRLGGVSEGIYTSMNLSYTRGDDPACVDENFARICDAMGLPVDGVVISAQEHHVNLANVTAADCGKGKTLPGYKDVDGLLTDEPGVVLCTQYADCVPLLFADPKKRVVAASHAGWRGTVAEIGRLTVERMQRDYGCDPADILAAIAPSIGKCCFEVDTPVYDAFREMQVFDDGCFIYDVGDKYHIDLWEVNRRVLLSAGVKADNITVTDLCTRCYPELFWSHRKTGPGRGSLAAFIGMTE